MFATETKPIARWIDEAQALCQPATGKALAALLGLTEPSLSQVKKGQRKLTKDQVERLAQMLEIEARALWQQQAAEEWDRSKGQRGLANLAALFVAFLAAVLLAGASGLTQSQPTGKNQKCEGNAVHIVAILRRMALLIAGALKLEKLWPMPRPC